MLALRSAELELLIDPASDHIVGAVITTRATDC
jgi:hypothetical protein